MCWEIGQGAIAATASPIMIGVDMAHRVDRPPAIHQAVRREDMAMLVIMGRLVIEEVILYEMGTPNAATTIEATTTETILAILTIARADSLPYRLGSLCNTVLIISNMNSIKSVLVKYAVFNHDVVEW